METNGICKKREGLPVELRQLRYFTAVAETLNFSRAAETLYISQSALSQQIADLEREMGVELLRRSKRSVELTAAGKALLQEAKKLLHQSEKLVPYVRGQNETRDRELLLGVDYSVDLGYGPSFRVHLADCVYAMRKQTPGLRPTFRMFEHPDLVRALDIGTIDLGFFLHFDERLQGECRAELESRVLRQEEMVLVLRSDHEFEDTPETVQALLKKRGLFLLERETKGMSQILRILDAIGAQPHIRFSDSRNVMVLTAESGESAMVLPASVARGLRNPSLRSLHFRVPEAVCNLLAVWKRENPNSLAPQMADMLADKFMEC